VKVGDRVIMVRADGWGNKGWTGTVNSTRGGGNSVSVKWDIGKNLAHRAADLAILGTEDNPNIMFRMHKLDKEKMK